MPILNAHLVQVGDVGIQPQVAYILTNDTVAAVLTAGYLNHYQQNNPGLLNDTTMCLVTTKTAVNATSTEVGWYEVSYNGSTKNWSLVPSAGAGSVVLPTIANHIATYTNTTGTLSEDPATAISGGNIQAGFGATPGSVVSYPGAAASGTLKLAATVNATGNFSTTITNDNSYAQDQIVTIPDSGASSPSFVLNTSTAGQFVTLPANSAAPSLGSLSIGTINSAATMTSGVLYGAFCTAVIESISGGGVSGCLGSTSSDGTISGTGAVAGTYGVVDLTGGIINGGSVAPVRSGWIGTSPTQTDMSKTHGFSFQNDTAAIVNSIYYSNSNATYLLETAGGTNFYAAAGTASGSAGNATHCAAQQVIKVYVNGAAVFIPVFTQNT